MNLWNLYSDSIIAILSLLFYKWYIEVNLSYSLGILKPSSHLSKICLSPNFRIYFCKWEHKNCVTYCFVAYFSKMKEIPTTHSIDFSFEWELGFSVLRSIQWTIKSRIFLAEKEFKLKLTLYCYVLPFCMLILLDNPWLWGDSRSRYWARREIPLRWYMWGSCHYGC